MRDLYPPIEAYDLRRLSVPGGHELYVEQSGCPDGQPVLFLHGGPGSGAKPDHRRYFDPQRYRVVIADQRGSGRSTPHGRLQFNNTGELVADLERIREALEIERWLLFGGSWGVALALAYGERHARCVTGLILRGGFLARREDIDWYLVHGPPRLLPEAWEEFLVGLPARARSRPVPYLLRIVTSAETEQRLQAARAWDAWTKCVVSYCLEPEPGVPEAPEETPEAAARRVGIELHYALHGYFLEPGQLLRDVAMLPSVPITIIHGRRDITCTPSAAWALHRALPDSELLILPRAGHLAGEPQMRDALLKVTDRYARLLA